MPINIRPRDRYGHLPSSLTIDDLLFPEQFVLWAMRYWFHADATPAARLRVLEAAFDRLSLRHAGALLDQLLTAAAHGGAQGLRFLPPCQLQVIAEERQMLDTLAAMQTGSMALVVSRLDQQCPPTTGRALLSLGRMFVQTLASAGLQLRRLGAAPDVARRQVIRLDERRTTTLH